MSLLQPGSEKGESMKLCQSENNSRKKKRKLFCFVVCIMMMFFAACESKEGLSSDSKPTDLAEKPKVKLTKEKANASLESLTVTLPPENQNNELQNERTPKNEKVDSVQEKKTFHNGKEVYRIYTQIELNEHDSYLNCNEYTPRIWVYTDGTFDALFNYYEGIFDAYGNWSASDKESEEVLHFTIQNYSGRPYLDFYIVDTGSCDAFFVSDYDYFGMTSSEGETYFHFERYTGRDIEGSEVTSVKDLIDLKIEAADNSREIKYDSILRDTENYLSKPYYISGTVTFKNNYYFVVTTGSGEDYTIWDTVDIYGDTCANVIRKDQCSVFGWISGVDEDETNVCMNAFCVLQGSKNSIPQEDREKDRAFYIYTETGDEFYYLTKEKLFQKQYRLTVDDCKVAFQEKQQRDGLEYYRVTVSFGKDENHYDLTGNFYPWERKFLWDFVIGHETRNTDFGLWWISLKKSKYTEKLSELTQEMKTELTKIPTPTPLPRAEHFLYYDQYCTSADKEFLNGRAKVLSVEEAERFVDSVGLFQKWVNVDGEELYIDDEINEIYYILFNKSSQEYELYCFQLGDEVSLFIYGIMDVYSTLLEDDKRKWQLYKFKKDENYYYPLTENEQIFFHE